MKLPFDLLLPRIEALENEMRHGRHTMASGQMTVAPADPSLRHGIDSLTRAWLRLSNDVSALAGRVPEAATRAIDARIAAFESKVAAMEAGTAIARLSETVDSLTRTWLQLQNEITSQAALISGLRDELNNRVTQICGAVSAQGEAVATLRHEIGGQGARIAEVQHVLGADVAKRDQRVDETLRFLLDRVEFVRREMMFELRYGAAVAPREAVHPRILSPEKVNAARAAGALRLNLGCGHIALPDYVNVDMRELPEIDVIADVGALPFEPGSIDEIFSAHLVEHFPQEKMVRHLLPHWLKLLKPGGMLRAITPDGAAMLAAHANGSYAFEDFRDVLFGGQDYEGDFHFNMFTPETLMRMVERAGFVSLAVPVRGLRNGQCFEFELTARAPGAPAATEGNLSA